MRRRRFGSLVQGVVRVALASSLGATAYACSGAIAGNSGGAAGGAGGDGGVTNAADAGPFADEATFACVAPLPGILETLTPAVPVDYLELRQQAWVSTSTPGPTDAGPQGAPTAIATHGTPCATASDHAKCLTALAALTLVNDQSGWDTDGDIDGPPHPGFPSTKDFVVFTRGDTAGALYGTADLAAFLGTIDSLEEARLVLQSMNQTLVCTTDPRKSGWRQNGDGSWDLLITGSSCTRLMEYRIRYHVAKDGTVTKVARDPTLDPGRVCGRRPAGLTGLGVADESRDSLAEHLVEAAYLEAASVVAFRRLELELRRFGAPESLVSRAERARVEEIGHARETARLARRHDGVVPALEVEPMTRRDLFAVALENAVEGCVRETYGALVSAFQAERCAPELRPLFRRIAQDEARHAELAHDVARWIDRKLTPEQRANLADARKRALAELGVAIHREPGEAVARVAGMPTASEARVLLEGLDRTFLAAA